MDHFFATKFCIYFSENPANAPTNAIFLEQKTLQKVMKFTHFDVLGGPFVHRDQASRREPKIMRNCVKMHLKSSQNDRRKRLIPLSQWSKKHAVAGLAKMHQNAFISVVSGIAFFTLWMKKLIKIIENWPQNGHEKYGPRFVNDQKRAPSTDLQKSIEMRISVVFSVLLCSRYGFKNRLKSSQIIAGGL